MHKVIIVVDTEVGINKLDDLIIDGDIQRADKERQSGRVRKFQNSWDIGDEIPPINIVVVLNYPTGKKMYVYDGVTRCKAAMQQIAEGKPCRLYAVIASSQRDWNSMGDKLYIARLFEKTNSGKKVNTLDLVAARAGAGTHPTHGALLSLYNDLRPSVSWDISLLYRLALFFLTKKEAYGLNGNTLLDLMEGMIDKDGINDRDINISHIINCLEEFFEVYDQNQIHFFPYLQGRGIFSFYPLKRAANVTRDCRFYEGVFRFFWIAREEGADSRRMKEILKRCDLTEFYSNKHQYKITKSEERPNLIINQLIDDYNHGLSMRNRLNPEKFKVRKISKKMVI